MVTAGAMTVAAGAMTVTGRAGSSGGIRRSGQAEGGAKEGEPYERADIQQRVRDH